VGGLAHIRSKKIFYLTKVLARRSCEAIAGSLSCEFDELVPLSLSLLEGSYQIILQDTFHGGIFGTHWYCSVSGVIDELRKIEL
tara:strand:- start:311 stop:562 length:252 start_codon:yes stop_codon:yes gene_type:complete